MKGESMWLMGPAPKCPTTPFGGVGHDVFLMMKGGGGIGIPFGLLDMPFSLAGDIVTLPWATYAYVQELRHPSDRDDPWSVGYPWFACPTPWASLLFGRPWPNPKDQESFSTQVPARGDPPPSLSAKAEFQTIPDVPFH
jgi:hypothetical protein